MSDRDARIAWFKAVILPHEGALHRHLRRSVRVAEEREDIVGEVLARAYATVGWERIVHGRSYLYTIARNLILDRARRDKIVAFDRIADLGAFDLVDDEPTADRVVFARDELRRLHAAVDRLPPQQGRVFTMRRIQEKSPRDIAEELGLSVSTVEKHLASALAALVAMLAEADGPGDATEGAWRQTAKP